MRRARSDGLRQHLATAAVLLAVAAAGAGCGSGTDGQAAASDASGATPGDAPSEPVADATIVDITVTDGEITPNGEAVEVGVGEEVDLVVIADAPGEIHVHSDPEASFEYDGTGEPETFTVTIDRPGQVEVESHNLEKLIVKLVVS